MSEDLLGKAFLLNDSIVRWVIHISKRGWIHLNWLDEDTETWHIGGPVKLKDFTPLIVKEVPAPKSGDSILTCGPTGHVRRIVVP